MKTIGFQTFLLTTDASVGEFFRLKTKAFLDILFRIQPKFLGKKLK